MKSEYRLPPSNVYNNNKLDDTDKDKFSFLEIEVSRINFITDKSIKAQTSASTSASAAAESLYESPGQAKAEPKECAGTSCVSGVGIGAVTAKIIWWGEQWETAASVSISCDACSSSSTSSKSNGIKKLSQIRKQSSRQQQHNNNYHLQQHHHHHNKLRYCVRSKSLALFLDYLRECPSIEIVASSNNSSSDVNDHAHDQESASAAAAAATVAQPQPSAAETGAARLPLPAPLLRKYAANYTNGCNFEYKTTIYALYRHLKSRGTSGQVQQQQQLRVGELQLRFKMLFAAAAAGAAASANKTVRIGAGTATSLSLPKPAALLLQDQQHQQHHQLTNNNYSQSQTGERISGTVAAAVAVAPAKVELMEAMKKLDADLVALFATAAEPKIEQLKEQLWPEQALPEQEHRNVTRQQMADEEEQATPELFKQVNALQLHLEALTLQPEGTKRMELLQSEVRPIFTVECQLSNELINCVPRADMFHLMQFESEKFQSLTQCTRFGQTQMRQVHLPALVDASPEQKQQQHEQEQEQEQLGCINFTIWWREPGTCLNELLGMGRLHLSELYQASLLEQCKCIAIQRRDLHLASLYLKISLRADLIYKTVTNGQSSNNSSTSSSSSKNNGHSAAAAGNSNSNNNIKESNSKAAATQPMPPPFINKNNKNNKASLESVNFMAETTKVRLLRGYIYASEMRQLSTAATTGCRELIVWKPFWQVQPLSVHLNHNGVFQLHEQFAVINDDKFLSSVERQHLILEIRPLAGHVNLPLHQFYIAYKDDSITNHLCKGKLPVISIDGWAPIVNPETQARLGELKVLLAIGSEAQIAELKRVRGFDPENSQPSQQRTTDLLDMLQNALIAPPSALSGLSTSRVVSAPAKPTPKPAPTPVGNSFTFSLHIIGAAGLPLNPGYAKSSKKQLAKRQAAAKRFPPNEPPNTYVTFQALDCNSQTYKSHEGLVYATPIADRSRAPQWETKFQVLVDSEYLSNPQKLFILKVWKKTGLSSGASTEPTPLEDAIIGFAAVNLGDSLSSGWHNIVDFNGRITGGLEVNLDGLPRGPRVLASSTGNVDNAIEQFEESLELRHLQLGQAIKRKFTELEQISNRLRTRLVDVTGQSLQSPQYDVDKALDNWKPDEMQQWHEDDDLVADFERALQTPTPTPETEAEAEAAAAAATPTAQSQADGAEEE